MQCRTWPECVASAAYAVSECVAGFWESCKVINTQKHACGTQLRTQFLPRLSIGSVLSALASGLRDELSSSSHAPTEFCVGILQISHAHNHAEVYLSLDSGRAHSNLITVLEILGMHCRVF